jgi:SAM-dependent methyltransferase
MGTDARADGQPDGRKASWDEADSREFLDTGRFFVPDREEQIEALCSQVPPPPPGDDRAVIVELCCGEGLLSAALLARFPGARVVALDGSPAMLEAARRAATTTIATISGSDAADAPGSEIDAGRFEARLFDLADRSWRRFPFPVHAFLSSLAVHHLDGAGKRELYADLARALAPGGALLLADLVEPATPEARALAAASWNESVRRRALDLAGHLGPYETFRDLRWNLYDDPEEDPADHPSPLFDQLRWLAEAGLAAVDVFWMKAGHAVFGGRKPA